MLLVLRHAETVEASVGPELFRQALAGGQYDPTVARNLPPTVPARPAPEYELDSPLSATGLWQAHVTGLSMRRDGLRLAAVYSAPSLAAAQTAHAIVAANRGAAPGNPETFLVEPGLADWAGWRRGEDPAWLAAGELRDAGLAVDVDACAFPAVQAGAVTGGESFERYEDRHAYAARTLLARHLGAGGAVLFVGHSCTLGLVGRPLREADRLGPEATRRRANALTWCAVSALQQHADGRWGKAQPPSYLRLVQETGQGVAVPFSSPVAEVGAEAEAGVEVEAQPEVELELEPAAADDDELLAWLTGHGLGEYAPLLRELGVATPDDARFLQPGDYHERIGKPVHRRKMDAAVASLSAAEPPPAPTPAPTPAVEMDALAPQDDFEPGYDSCSFMFAQEPSPTSAAGAGAQSGEDAATWHVRCQDVQIGEAIGEGYFGTVHRARWAATDVVLKRFKTGVREGELANFQREVRVLSRLRHPHIVQFLGACMPAAAAAEPEREPFESGRELFILLELMRGGSLRAALEAGRALDRGRVLREVAAGMSYLHAHSPPILHRDLSSANILLDEHGKAKVADFGLSKQLEDGDEAYAGKTGNLFYTACEIFRGHPFTTASDVYSFGLLAWELYSGAVPLAHVAATHVPLAVASEGLRPDLAAARGMPPALQQLAGRCWQEDPDGRPTFAELLGLLS